MQVTDSEGKAGDAMIQEFLSTAREHTPSDPLAIAEAESPKA
jgi:hypothetical protein